MEGPRGDLEWGSIAALVRSAADRYGDRQAVVDPPVELTFKSLGAAVERASRAAIASGIEPGDRFAVWAPNIHEWIVAALGGVSAGGVLVPINTRFKGPEAGYVLREERRPDPVHRAGLPGHRLPRRCCATSTAEPVTIAR